MKKAMSVFLMLIMLSIGFSALAAELPRNSVDNSMFPKVTPISEESGNRTYYQQKQEENAEVPKKSFSERLKEKKAKEGRENYRRANLGNMPKVAVMYINNAKTTYDDEIDQVILNMLTNAISLDYYQYIDGAPYIERMSKIGIVDITTAERSDIIDAFEGDDIDYAVFVQVDPFIRKDKKTFFTVGKEMTATVPFKIIDVKNNKYLYNGRFSEIAKDSSMMGNIGNKSVTMKALNQVTEKATSVIDVRLPKTKAEPIQQK